MTGRGSREGWAASCGRNLSVTSWPGQVKMAGLPRLKGTERVGARPPGGKLYIKCRNIACCGEKGKWPVRTGDSATRERCLPGLVRMQGSHRKRGVRSNFGVFSCSKGPKKWVNSVCQSERHFVPVGLPVSTENRVLRQHSEAELPVYPAFQGSKGALINLMLWKRELDFRLRSWDVLAVVSIFNDWVRRSGLCWQACQGWFSLAF